MILRNRIPKNLVSGKQTKDDFIYFTQTAVPCQFFSGFKCLEKRFHAATLNSKGKHAHQIEILLFVCLFLHLFPLFSLHS